MNSEIRAALYAAFGSDYDESDRERITLMYSAFGIHSPLEEMSWDDLGKLQDKGSIYSATVLKYVLPRWLELLDEEGRGCPDFMLDEDNFKWRLQGEHWLQWPSYQVESVRMVFREWGQARMREGHMEGFVDFLSQLEEEVAPYLDPWLRARPLEVAQWVGAQNWMRVGAALVRWVSLPRVEERLEAAFWANPDGDHAEVFSGVTLLLRSVRALNAGRK